MTQSHGKFLSLCSPCIAMDIWMELQLLQCTHLEYVSVRGRYKSCEQSLCVVVSLATLKDSSTALQHERECCSGMYYYIIYNLFYIIQVVIL